MGDVVPFPLGRSQPSRGDAKRLSLVERSVASLIPDPPSVLGAARLRLVQGMTYPMMGNDRYGDCTVASRGHIIQVDTTTEKHANFPSDQTVIDQYLGLTGGPDVGLTLLDVLKPWQKGTLDSHTLAAYAEIPWTDTHLSAAQTRKLMKVSVWVAGSAYLAFSLPYGLQRDSYNWTKVGTGPDWRPGSWGGHAVPAVLYAAGGKFYIVTWGRLVEVSEAFMRAFCDEAWMVVTLDRLNSHGKTPTGRTLQAVADLAGRIAA